MADKKPKDKKTLLTKVITSVYSEDEWKMIDSFSHDNRISKSALLRQSVIRFIKQMKKKSKQGGEQ